MDDFREFEIRQKEQLRRRARTIPSEHPEADDPPDESTEKDSDTSHDFDTAIGTILAIVFAVMFASPVPI